MKLKTLKNVASLLWANHWLECKNFKTFPPLFEKWVKMWVIRYQHEYATHIWEFRKCYPILVCFRVKSLFQLGLLEVITWPGSRFFRKKFFKAQVIWCPPPFVIFSCPKFCWLITSIHLSKGFIMVEWSWQIHVVPQFLT